LHGPVLIAEDQAPEPLGSSEQIDAVQMASKKGALTSGQYRAYPLYLRTSKAKRYSKSLTI
jgi:hypothetical protein